MFEPLPATLDDVDHRLRAGDGAGAAALLAAVTGATPAQVLERRARAHYLALDIPASIAAWEQAYAAHRAEGDGVGAVRAARLLGFLHGAVLGDAAVMSGWLARAQRLLDVVDDPAERGWVALNRGMFEPDRPRREERFGEALALARRTGDTELELVALAYLGANLVHDDRIEEGMLLLDEALAGVAGREVEDFTIFEEIFCQLFSACEHARDIRRADQWIRVGEAIAAERNLPAVSAFCRTHYGGVLTEAGRWLEAEATLVEAVRLWGLGFGPLRAGALVRLADLRARQGRLEEAEQLLEGLEDHVEAARPLAAVHLARGETDLARYVLDRALRQVGPTAIAAAPLLALLLDLHLATGEVDAAREAADGLDACAAAHPSEYLTALAALGRGQVCLATGEGDPRACLDHALAGFRRAELPMELARARLVLAGALASENVEAAVTEARGALAAFERLQAARDADAAAALLRFLGGPAARRRPTARQADHALSRREAEVLALVGHGLSNPEIAERLYISRRTVEHHVGSILAKLGLRSRAEAAAYAARGGSASR